MKKAAKVGLIALVLAVGILPSEASAVIFLCGDICMSWQSCTRQCIDDTSGFQIKCGDYGCCSQVQWNCGGLNAVATVPQANSNVSDAVCPAGDPRTSAPTNPALPLGVAPRLQASVTSP